MFIYLVVIFIYLFIYLFGFGGGGEGNIYVAADFMNCISVVLSFFIVSNFHTRTGAFLLPLSDVIVTVFLFY